MLNISNALLERLAIWTKDKTDVEWESKMDVHLVNQNDIFYKKGRQLASQVYNEVWGTEKLIDDNDYGIVVIHKGKVVGNSNIEIKKEDKQLKSEKFFGSKHWECCTEVSNDQIVEISGLSISQDVPHELRQPILMLLVFSSNLLGRSIGRSFAVSVQRKALNRILKKYLHLPFYYNHQIQDIKGEIPQDKYWQDGEQPCLCYIDSRETQTIESMNSYLCYLNSIGIQTNFMSRFHPQPTSYAKFRKSSLFTKQPLAV